MAVSSFLVAAAPGALQATAAEKPDLVVGNTGPYSGPASSYSTMAKGLSAYFDMLNEQGGIRGRSVKFISYDDAYSPPKTVEQVRRLVEDDNVSVLLGMFGTGPNAAVQKYLNAKKIPQLFLITASGRFGHPENFAGTMGWQPTLLLEAKIFGQYILRTKPNAKIGIISQNDDLGRDAVAGLKAALGPRATEMIVSSQVYNSTDPVIDAQIAAIKAAGADTIYDAATAKYAAQAIKKAHEIDWHPLHLLSSISANISTVLKPAGVKASRDIISAFFLKDSSDPQWSQDLSMQAYKAWMGKYYSAGDIENPFNVIAYSMGQTFQKVAESCGDDVSGANIMAKAASMNFDLPMLLPGIVIKTSSSDYFPLQQMRLGRFDGERWQLFGDVFEDEADLAEPR
ncbi:ABC transporter substrate-binding protein [Bradyrhizobium genosp. P]|uniref:ABC transporter substrate-binding protein n=1 Tax=Bradyrhizobium genosp. P TaxID=83641 RepID=UPI003CECDB6E